MILPSNGVACPLEDIVKKMKVDEWVASEPELESEIQYDSQKGLKSD